jgi:hypothetical protein
MIGNTNVKSYNNIEYDKNYIDNNIYTIKVVDYDGTIIDAQNLNNGQDYTLPQVPSHDGLTFQAWSGSRSVVNNKITNITHNIIMGAVYTTTSGQNEFDIELTVPTGLSVTLNMNGTKDWGDGTTDSNTSHTYSNYGEYTIKCDGTTMTTSSSSGLFGQTTNNINYYIKNIRLSGITNIADYAFQNCYSLINITLPYTITSIGNYAFRDCRSLLNAVIPNNVTSIGNYSFNGCRSLLNIVIPYNLTTIGNYSFNGCSSLISAIISDYVTSLGTYIFYGCNSLIDIRLPNNGSVTSLKTYSFNSCNSLTNIIIPSYIRSINSSCFTSCLALKNVSFLGNITTIESNAFSNCYNITEYNFSNNTSVPSLNTVGSLSGINDICKIKVPFNLYYNWITASNWDTYEKYIVSLGSAIINFTGDNTGNIYVNNYLISGTSTTWGGTSMPYYVYDIMNNIVLPTQIVTGITNGSTKTVNIDLSSKKKITLQTGITGLNVTFTIEDKTYNSTSDNNGNYYIYVVGSGVTLDYSIYDVNNNYQSINGTITTTNSDITQIITYNKLTLSTGVSGLNAIFTINNNTYTSMENNGNYYMYTTGSNITVNYYINGGDNYFDEEDSIITTGSNITENITLTPATTSSWTRPNLTANGTLGGDSFAVSAEAYSTSASYQAWRAVDNSTSTSYYWYSKSNGTRYYTFYNPDALKVSQIICYFTASNYRSNSLYIEGSNNNSNWVSIESTYSYTTSSPYTGTLVLTNNDYYKYYRLRFVPYISYIRLYDMLITAIVKTAV